MGIVEFFTTILDLIFLFFASLFDFSGQVEYRHPQIGQGNTHNNARVQQPNGGYRAQRIPMGGCIGGACGR